MSERKEFSGASWMDDISRRDELAARFLEFFNTPDIDHVWGLTGPGFYVIHELDGVTVYNSAIALAPGEIIRVVDVSNAMDGQRGTIYVRVRPVRVLDSHGKDAWPRNIEKWHDVASWWELPARYQRYMLQRFTYLVMAD